MGEAEEDVTPTEADTLAKRIINTWRGGPPLTEWIDVLGPLEAGRAGTAFVRLRGDSENPPSIARFRQVYASLHTASSDAKCASCGGDGWVTATPVERWGVEYRTARPCHCNTSAKVETKAFA